MLEWVESRGRINDLIDGTLAFIPASPELQKLREPASTPSPTSPSISLPKPANPITLVEPPLGTMNPNSPLYVERHADNQLLHMRRWRLCPYSKTKMDTPATNVYPST